ncbi:MAG: hypothetical protein QM784_29210 [Polyangiaceae bacterium]
MLTTRKPTGERNVVGRTVRLDLRTGKHWWDELTGSRGGGSGERFARVSGQRNNGEISVAVADLHRFRRENVVRSYVPGVARAKRHVDASNCGGAPRRVGLVGRSRRASRGAGRRCLSWLLDDSSTESHGIPIVDITYSTSSP